LQTLLFRQRRTRLHGFDYKSRYASNTKRDFLWVLGTYSVQAAASCQAVGFFTQLAFDITGFYNGAMGTHCTLVFFFHWTDQKWTSKLEPCLHTTAVLWSLMVSTGVTTDMYVSDHPNAMFLNCYPSQEKAYSGTFIWLSGSIELNYMNVIKPISVLCIAYAMHRQEKLMALLYANSLTASITDRQEPGTNATERPSYARPPTPPPPQSLQIARQTRIQSFIYLMSCVIPYLPMILLRLVDLYWDYTTESKRAPKGLFVYAVICEVLHPA
jgi:hypothetical protein